MFCVLGKNSVASNANDVLMNKLNYILLGDPALQLNSPSYKMAVTEINDTLLSEVEADSLLLKARSRITVKGEIRSHDDAKLPDFNGLVLSPPVRFRERGRYRRKRE